MNVYASRLSLSDREATTQETAGGRRTVFPRAKTASFVHFARGILSLLRRAGARLVFVNIEQTAQDTSLFWLSPQYSFFPLPRDSQGREGSEQASSGGGGKGRRRDLTRHVGKNHTGDPPGKTWDFWRISHNRNFVLSKPVRPRSQFRQTMEEVSAALVWTGESVAGLRIRSTLLEDGELWRGMEPLLAVLPSLEGLDVKGRSSAPPVYNASAFLPVQPYPVGRERGRGSMDMTNVLSKVYAVV